MSHPPPTSPFPAARHPRPTALAGTVMRWVVGQVGSLLRRPAVGVAGRHLCRRLGRLTLDHEPPAADRYRQAVEVDARRQDGDEALKPLLPATATPYSNQEFGESVAPSSTSDTIRSLARSPCSAASIDAASSSRMLHSSVTSKPRSRNASANRRAQSVSASPGRARETKTFGLSTSLSSGGPAHLSKSPVVLPKIDLDVVQADHIPGLEEGRKARPSLQVAGHQPIE